MNEILRVGPVLLTAGTFGECVASVADVARRREPKHFHFVNAYTIALADSDPDYATLLNDRVAVNFTDGVPVAWLGRRAYGFEAGQWPRVYGPDVMEAVLSRDDGLRHFLLGGDEETLAALKRSVERRWPHSIIAGSESPPFRSLTTDELRDQDARICDSGADLIWVGLGTPKQDWEAARIAKSTGIPTLAVGAAFDFIAGTKPQAPVWMQRSGTEWVFRLATEPRRLARRYLWGNPRFLLAVAKTPGLRKPHD